MRRLARSKKQQRPLTTSLDTLAFIRRTFSLDGEVILRRGVPLARTNRRRASYAKVHIRRVNGLKITWKVSRLKFFLATGEIPEVVDHKSCDTRDDRLSNLRAANPQLNAWNSRAPRKRKRKLPRNVSRSGNKYVAYIKHSGKKRHLGLYDTAEEASQVARKESERLRGAFHRYRRKHTVQSSTSSPPPFPLLRDATRRA